MLMGIVDAGRFATDVCSFSSPSTAPISTHIWPSGVITMFLSIFPFLRCKESRHKKLPHGWMDYTTHNSFNLGTLNLPLAEVCRRDAGIIPDLHIYNETIEAVHNIPQ